MKWFIASDIHGSFYYCQKMINAFKAEKADKMLLLGDILYHGPRNDLPADYNPKAVIGLLNNFTNEIICIRGNCDAQVDDMVLDFPILSNDLCICIDEIFIFATHGHIFNETNLPPLNKCSILLTGHTHIPCCNVYEKYTYINPGSVSIPKNDSHNGYLILENRVFRWKDFDGNIIKEFNI